jgi:hypothetical protein
MTEIAGCTAAVDVDGQWPVWAVIYGRTYWISAMLRVRESQLRAQNDECCTRKERSGRRVSGASASLQILLFVLAGLKSTNRLASDVHQLS